MRHFDFQYLLKADDDTFVCLTRIASMLHDLDPEVADKIYAGVPTACNQDTNPDYWVRKEISWKIEMRQQRAAVAAATAAAAVFVMRCTRQGRALFVRSL